MGVSEEAADRFEALADHGQQLMGALDWAQGIQVADPIPFAAWRTRSLTALRTYLPDRHHSFVEFDEQTKHGDRSEVEHGVGILRGLAADARDGFLFTRVSNLIAAEVFSDFLEMAQHLVAKDHFHAAASLTGAVLEDLLRRLADANKIKYTKRDGLDSLNVALAKAGIYNMVDKRRIDVWRQVRNDADHGNWDKVRPDDVRDMLKHVTDFVARQIT